MAKRTNHTDERVSEAEEQAGLEKQRVNAAAELAAAQASEEPTRAKAKQVFWRLFMDKLEIGGE